MRDSKRPLISFHDLLLAVAIASMIWMAYSHGRYVGWIECEEAYYTEEEDIFSA